MNEDQVGKDDGANVKPSIPKAPGTSRAQELRSTPVRNWQNAFKASTTKTQTNVNRWQQATDEQIKDEQLLLASFLDTTSEDKAESTLLNVTNRRKTLGNSSGALPRSDWNEREAKLNRASFNAGSNATLDDAVFGDSAEITRSGTRSKKTLHEIKSPFVHSGHHDKDRLHDNAEKIENLMASENNESKEAATDGGEVAEVLSTDEEALGNAIESTPMMRHLMAKRYTASNKRPGFWSACRRNIRILCDAFDMPYVKERLWSFVHKELSLIIIPLLAIAAFFFYTLGNPSLDFLPSDATLSYWCLFLLRNCITLMLAYVTEYLVVDVFITKSPLALELVGPLPSLYIMNSKGWPFITTSWAVWNKLLICEKLHKTLFEENWLFFTGIDMFTAENNSGNIAESEFYAHFLLALFLVGILTAAKRTTVSIFMTCRLVAHYKPKLQSLMGSMVLLTDVADLAGTIGRVNDGEIEEAKQDDTLDVLQEESSSRKMVEDKVRSRVMKKVLRTYASERNTKHVEFEPNTIHGHWHEMTSEGAGKKTASPKSSQSKDAPVADKWNVEVDLMVNPDTTSLNELKAALDDWEGPANMPPEQESPPSLAKILMFRKALKYIDGDTPFGQMFGPACTRDACLRSAKSLYKRLISLNPNSPVLHMDVVGMLAYDSTASTLDETMAKSLVELMRPDMNDEISLLAFCRSCDVTFKELKRFQADVANATKIDGVLERIFNIIFNSILALMVVCIFEINPWTLFASLSSVVFAFTFAFGGTVAKVVEGMMMIAVRRPYGLGDKISIVANTMEPKAADPGHPAIWIVEECNLFITTLRLARSNEVSTVRNGAIANARIVNFTRSENALVNISFALKLHGTTDEHLSILKSSLEQYIFDNSQTWSNLVNWRLTKVLANENIMIWTARIQHRQAWGFVLPVLTARGEIEQFCEEVMGKLGICHTTPPSQNAQALYIKETPAELSLSQQDSRLSEGKQEHEDTATIF